MGACGDLARGRVGRIDPQRLGVLHVGTKGIAMRQREPRHPIGQRRLADARRASDQPGMRNPPAAIGIQQRKLGFAMSEQRGGLAADAPPISGFRPGAHSCRIGQIAGGSGEETVTQRRPDVGGDNIGLRGGVDQHAALRVAGGDLPVRLAQSLVKLDVFRLEPVGRPGATAGGLRVSCRLRPGHRE